MKNLTKIYYSNWWLLAITIVLYLTIWIGAIFHILFGVFQLVISLYLLFHYKKLPEKIQYQLLLYFLITTIVILVPIVTMKDYIIHSWFATWVLALYFIGILYQTTKLKL